MVRQLHSLKNLRQTPEEEPTNKLKIEDEWLKNIKRNVIVEIKQMLDDNFKRSDYKEVVELSLFYWTKTAILILRGQEHVIMHVGCLFFFIL